MHVFNTMDIDFELVDGVGRIREESSGKVTANEST